MNKEINHREFKSSSKTTLLVLRTLFLWIIIFCYYITMKFILHRRTNFSDYKVMINGSIVVLQPVIFGLLISSIPVLFFIVYYTYHNLTSERSENIEPPKIENTEKVEKKAYIEFLVPHSRKQMYWFYGFQIIILGTPLLWLIVGRFDLFVSNVSDLFLFIILDLYIIGYMITQKERIQSYLTAHPSQYYIGCIFVEAVYTVLFIGWLDFYLLS